MGSDARLAPGGLAGTDVVVESTMPAAQALAQFLAAEGAGVRVATPAALDVDPRANTAFLDAWTPEVAPRVAGLRAGGALVTCLADLVLARAAERVTAITGTAGKTTTTSFTIQLLRAAGVEVVAPEPGISGNLWPEAAVLAGVERPSPIVTELTSSHLAFCGGSPHVAVVTSFWPDHVELHGSLEAYARAKETIARSQGGDGVLIVPADGSCERFVGVSPARVARFSAEEPVEVGAFVRAGMLVVRWRGSEHVVAELERLPVRGRLVANVLAACVAALAGGAEPVRLDEGCATLEIPRHRLVEVARYGGVPVLDDSMAGTPAKAAAALELFPDHSLLLVAGGETQGAGGPVHATAEERELLAAACELAVRKVRRIVLFGPAAAMLAPLLPGAEIVDDLADALRRAVALAPAAVAVLVAPMFPLDPAERASVSRLARRASGAPP